MNQPRPRQSNAKPMSNEKTTEQAVIAFVAYFMNLDRQRITPDSRLRQDLGIDGRDATAFFATFSQKYEVDISVFDIDTYFNREDFQFIKFLVSRMANNGHSSLLKDLRVSDLVRATEQKKLLPRSL